MNFDEIDYIVNNKILDDERIYKAFEPLIISSIQKYYDRADIFEELVDDGKTEIMYAIMEYDGSKKVPFNYYLKQRLRFFYLKKNPRRSVSSLNYTNEDGDEVMNLIESDENIEQDFEDRLEIKKLYEKVRKLPDKQQKIIYENFLREKSAREICKELNMKQSTFYNTRSKALENLRKMYWALGVEWWVNIDGIDAIPFLFAWKYLIVCVVVREFSWFVVYYNKYIF